MSVVNQHYRGIQTKYKSPQPKIANLNQEDENAHSFIYNIIYLRLPPD